MIRTTTRAMKHSRSYMPVLLVITGLFGAGSTHSAYAQQEASWEILMQASFEEIETSEGYLWKPTFPESVELLNEQSIRLQGFVIPLDYAEKHDHFLVSAYPGHGCFFHMPGGPESIVEVKAKEPIAFTYNTIAIEGRLELLRDDPYGLLYRVVDAKPVQ